MKKLFNAKTGLRGLYALVAAVAFIVVVVLNIVMGLLADRYPMNRIQNRSATPSKVTIFRTTNAQPSSQT